MTKVRRGDPEYRRIRVPSNLNLNSDYEETMEFIIELREAMLRRNEFVLLDFKECVSASAAAVIVLAAEIDRCRRLRTYLGKAKIAGNYPPSDEVYFFLRDIGFYSLLNVPAPRPGTASFNDERSFLIALRTGLRTKGQFVEAICDELLDDVATLTRGGLGLVYRGITEAMNNVTDHAYSVPTGVEYPVLMGQWWVAGYRDREARRVIYVMFDQGVGIPGTLPEKHGGFYEALKARVGFPPSDDVLIAAAMELGRSSTKQPERGYGLQDLRRLIEASTCGRLAILSRTGGYEYVKNETGEVERSWPLPISLGGTLVFWEISQSEDIRWEEQNEDD